MVKLSVSIVTAYGVSDQGPIPITARMNLGPIHIREFLLGKVTEA